MDDCWMTPRSMSSLQARLSRSVTGQVTGSYTFSTVSKPLPMVSMVSVPGAIARWANQTSLPAAKLNTDENPEVASRYGIRSIPALIVFRNGEAGHQVVGFRPKKELAKVLDSVLDSASAAVP